MQLVWQDSSKQRNNNKLLWPTHGVVLFPCADLICTNNYTTKFLLFSCFKQYLGSMLIKDLRGTESTQDACAKMRVGIQFIKILLMPREK